MKPAVWLALGLAMGICAGWYVRGVFAPKPRAATGFFFSDKLGDAQQSYLSVTGSWRGDTLTNAINTVEILCIAADKNCDLHQADLISASGGSPLLSTYRKSFRITKLDTQTIVAEASQDLCIRQTLTLDRVAKAVILVRTKINRENVCSVVQDEPLTLYLGEPLH
ncbi:hypothetical protein ACQR1Q_34925 [Bradyrhizobium oligotrophicum]|uniref:hypothetical protein n=1 Tax=Bradyrhizobium oligotrophicum TaxID=44255 RepID=UPI003EBC24BE